MDVHYGGCVKGVGEVLAGRLQEVVGFLSGDRRIAGIAGVVAIGGADEGEVALIGNREDDPPVFLLEGVTAAVVEQSPDDNVASLNKAHGGRAVGPGNVPKHIVHPGTGSIHHHPGAEGLVFTGVLVVTGHLPSIADPARLRHLGRNRPPDQRGSERVLRIPGWDLPGTRYAGARGTRTLAGAGASQVPVPRARQSDRQLPLADAQSRRGLSRGGEAGRHASAWSGLGGTRRRAGLTRRLSPPAFPPWLRASTPTRAK